MAPMEYADVWDRFNDRLAAEFWELACKAGKAVSILLLIDSKMSIDAVADWNLMQAI